MNLAQSSFIPLGEKKVPQITLKFSIEGYFQKPFFIYQKKLELFTTMYNIYTRCVQKITVILNFKFRELRKSNCHFFYYVDIHASHGR